MNGHNWSRPNHLQVGRYALIGVIAAAVLIIAACGGDEAPSDRQSLELTQTAAPAGCDASLPSLKEAHYGRRKGTAWAEGVLNVRDGTVFGGLASCR